MDPLKYELLRDEQGRAVEQRQAVENEQQRRAREVADRAAAARAAEQEKIKLQARREAELEKAKSFEWQKARYGQRQREQAAAQERAENRSAHLKENDPVEYAREQRDRQKSEQRAADEHGIKSGWEQQRTQAAKSPQREIPAREQVERSRENGEGAERKEPNKWRREMSEQMRQEIDRERANDEREREQERERSGR
jgi:hypothetical protein